MTCVLYIKVSTMMRLRRKIKAESGLGQFDIAPLIDVVFILLIFFMLTSNFMVQPGIRIDLPRAVTSKSIISDKINVFVSSEDIVYLNGKIVTIRQLEDVLTREKESIKSVFIRSDKNASLGRIVEIWDICKRIELTHVNIATIEQKP